MGTTRTQRCVHGVCMRRPSAPAALLCSWMPAPVGRRYCQLPTAHPGCFAADRPARARLWLRAAARHRDRDRPHAMSAGSGATTRACAPFSRPWNPAPLQNVYPVPRFPPAHTSAAFEAVAIRKSLILTPAEVYAECAHHGDEKAKFGWLKLWTLSIIAGCYVGYGFSLCLLVGGNLGLDILRERPGLFSLVFGAIGFPAAFTMIVVRGCARVAGWQLAQWGVMRVRTAAPACMHEGQVRTAQGAARGQRSGHITPCTAPVRTPALRSVVRSCSRPCAPT